MNLFGEVEPVKAEPVAPYLGGKSQLAKSIVGKIQQIEHVTFVDVFFGMGGVFFRRVSQPKAEVINDINAELVTLFRVLRSHSEILLQELSFMLASRIEFDALKKAGTTHMTDIQRAARFYYLQRLSFGGKSTGRSFGVSPDRPSRFDINQLRENLRLAASRLSSVTIESLDWREVISRYDSAGTLFYLDPPYWGGETDYGKGVFKREDFAEMAEVLSEIKGRFLLSLNDREEVRKTFEGFDLEQVHLNYSISKEAGKKVAELIISN
ncbi:MULTISPECIES: DNA adenine methylase [unclassified Pseudovibrio]|uniref:DNA adenine methylase n=1 Tax=unclassified Pseudovibrio TaxID=2627060 RepID=UPI000708FD41|nr:MULTISPECIES: DNA adenine methylase [unclassified Pseudovibrio]KZK99133.1 Modification methylase DpnIIA [Pseudovibrio sp. Ad26]